jgi:hypothetical protein
LPDNIFSKNPKATSKLRDLEPSRKFLFYVKI